MTDTVNDELFSFSEPKTVETYKMLDAIPELEFSRDQLYEFAKPLCIEVKFELKRPLEEDALLNNMLNYKMTHPKFMFTLSINSLIKDLISLSSVPSLINSPSPSQIQFKAKTGSL